MNIKKVTSFLLSIVILVTCIIPTQINANEKNTKEVTKLTLQAGKSYRIECVKDHTIFLEYSDDTVLEEYYKYSYESGEVLEDTKEQGDMAYIPMGSGDYRDIKVKSGSITIYTLKDGTSDEKEDLYEYFEVENLGHAPLKKYKLNAGDVISMFYPYYQNLGTSVKYNVIGTDVQSKRTKIDYFWHDKFGWDIGKEENEENGDLLYWTTIKEDSEHIYEVSQGEMIVYLGYEDSKKLEIDSTVAPYEDGPSDVGEGNGDKDDNEDTEPSDKTYTEREIFETYPESLDNETDDIIDDALNIADYYTDTANKNVDFLTLLKQSAGNIDDSIELILKSLFTGNTDFKNQEYIDEVVRQILYDALNNQDLLVECAQNLSSKYKDKYKNVKDAINLSIKGNIDYETTAEVLAKNFNGNIKEIEKAVKKTYNGWDSKLSKMFKKLDVGITYADTLLMAIQTQQMQEEMISLLRSKLPDSTIQGGLIRLQKDMKESFWNNITVEFLKEEITDEFVSAFKDLILNVGLDYMVRTPAGLARFLGEFIVENFAENFIPRDSVDAVVKNSVYMGTVCSIYSTILRERTKFVTAFTTEVPLENIEKEINNYHMLYDVFMSSVVGYLENSKDLADRDGERQLDKAIREIKQLDYDAYLDNCVKKIKKNAFYFSWREAENGVAITGINENQKAKMKTLSDGYDGSKMGRFLVVPDEINGKPVVSIDSNALTGDFDGIILGKNIKKLDENAIVSDKALSMIDINSDLIEFSENSLPDADVYKSASKVFNEQYANSKNILEYDDYVDSIEIATSPDNMDYTPSKGYDSKGLSIKVNKDNDSKVIKGGWLEYVTVENSKPVLNIAYADKKVKTELDLVKEKMNYNIHYVDTNFEQLKETDVVATDGLDYIEETAPEIKGYSLVDQINGFYLNDSQKDVYFIYRQNIAFEHGNYLVNFKDKVKVNIVGADNNKCAFTVEDKSIAEISKDGTIIPKKGGITTIKVSDEKGNYDSALLLVDDSIIKINFENEEYNISVGDSLKLEVLYAPEISTHSENLTFISDNPKVVAVNEEGVVTGLAKGKTKITVKTDNGLETTCIVNVSENKKDNTEEISNVDKTNNTQNELNDKDSPDTGSQSNIILFGGLTLVSILTAIILKRKSNQKAAKK